METNIYAAEPKPNWQSEWEKTVQGAKKEGKLSLYLYQATANSAQSRNSFRKNIPRGKSVDGDRPWESARPENHGRATGGKVSRRCRAARVRTRVRRRICSLISSFAQRSFQLGVKTAAYLRYSLIAILAKEGRWLVIFKNALTSLVFEQNHPERRVKSRRELIAGHL
jgi:hypothetical protein